jgi:hypothetical protein
VGDTVLVLGLGRLRGLSSRAQLAVLKDTRRVSWGGRLSSNTVPSLLSFVGTERFAIALVFLRILVFSASPLDRVVEMNCLFFILVLTCCCSILGLALLVLDVIGTFVIMAWGGAELS